MQFDSVFLHSEPLHARNCSQSLRGAEMGTEHVIAELVSSSGPVPEQGTRRAPSQAICGALASVDLSHTPSVQRSPLLAVTAPQASLLTVARGYETKFGVWPTAAELACAAFVKLPEVWADLRVLQRLGCVEWGKTVRVVRVADGVVMAAADCAAMRERT